MLTENNPNRRIILKKNPNYNQKLRPLIEHNNQRIDLNFDRGVDEAHFILEKEAIQFKVT